MERRHALARAIGALTLALAASSGLAACGEDDRPARHRDTLDADENPHERILVFSGSKIGRAPTTSTVTGNRSVMYSTARSVDPSTARSGGR